MAATTPLEAADIFMKAWSSRQWIVEREKYPAAPKDVDELYQVHLAMQEHAAASELGGHGGYKIGAVGQLGEACFYAPLFRNFFVDAPGKLSAASCQVHQIEPEFGMLLGADLAPRSDSAPHSAQDALAAVDSVALCIEFCGRRASAEITAEQQPLGKFADLLMAGGVLLGPRLPAAGLDAAALSGCATSLAVNGKELITGSGAACPEGGPAQSLAWLANHLNRRGLALQKGQLVITGATCITRDFKAGDTILAKFAGLGEVETTLEP